MSVQTDLPRVVAAVVAPDSPVGQLAAVIEELTSHLPAADQPRECALCSRSWPCDGFDNAAKELGRARIPVGLWVPLSLHPILWPQQPSFGTRAN
ncbi:hypothetical protein [Kutzneria buriramensis]|uniref:Uncharacterized protein n=1 Tax=Kutzneria buriramensis TaxID=1045776 RepID=A0A3E0GWM4_9PSEU|nr:hypothetical protein [Kutzneria buriramensis]REH31085.1 hypothetical protein BCF44_122108 [Kutzneria buriramensis]